MSNLYNYIKAPYTLSEDELRANTLTDICTLTKQINAITQDISRDLKIHVKNLDLIKKILDEYSKS